MTGEAFTRGPWRSVGKIKLIGNPDDGGAHNLYCGDVEPLLGDGGEYRGGICHIQSCDQIGGISRHEAIANSHLIASAPALYEALEQIVESGLLQGSYEVHDRLSTLAFAALSSARGEDMGGVG